MTSLTQNSQTAYLLQKPLGEYSSFCLPSEKENVAGAANTRVAPALVGTAKNGQGLGTTISIASTSPQNDKFEPVSDRRYRLQNVAADLLPAEGVSFCMKYTARVDPADPDSEHHRFVDIVQDKNTDRVTAHNLVRCNRLWVCPVCAARISEERRHELRIAHDYSGKHFIMATFTLRHRLGEPLREVLGYREGARYAGLVGAYSAFKSGRFWQDFKQEYDWLGDVRALEITHGPNGWHPHLHVMMCFDRKPDAGQIEALFKKRWLKTLAKIGLSGTWEHGLRVTTDNADIAAYIAKYGHLPAGQQDTWRAPEELAKSNYKMARAEGRTMWQILDDYDRHGDPGDAALFREYAAATKGKNQLTWSRGLRELLNIEALLAEHAPPEAETVVIMSLPREVWLALYWARRRGKLLQLCERGAIDEAKRLCLLSLRRYRHARGRASPWSWSDERPMGD